LSGYFEPALEKHPEDDFVLSITVTAKGKQVAAVLAAMEAACTAEHGTWYHVETERKHDGYDRGFVAPCIPTDEKGDGGKAPNRLTCLGRLASLLKDAKRRWGL
jgi:hypothetical protein